ncbi:MAG: type IV secretion system DNA-binding domain-containing protein [Betaproteobacteria bacterium]|nr:type IV secretion system DNA-binding domain-containing protein [Betaproteobacteria bacterium]
MGLLSTLIGGSQPAHTSPGITLGGVDLAESLESLHLLVVGTTGTGKTTLMEEALSTIAERGDRIICVDPNGHFLSRFGREEDIVLNPFDQRSPGWSLHNEVRRDWDFDRLGRSVIPDGLGSDAAWYGYAQMLLAELLRVLMRNGDPTTHSLLYWATSAPTEKLQELLKDTAAAGLFDPNAGKALASVRFILTSQLQPHKYLLPGDFSLRQWLADGQGSLFITWRSDMLASLQPLVRCWSDILLSQILSLPPSQARRLWFVGDELAAVGRLSSLENALTMGRKHGLRVMAGLQSVSQLERLYGRESATVLRSCFRSLVVFGVARTDPDTAEAMSRALGDCELDREQLSTTQGMQGTSKSANLHRVKERLVLPSEIASLPNLTAYLALAGNEPIRKIRISPQNLPVIAPAMMEA